MKKRRLALYIPIFLLSCSFASAQVQFAYNVDFSTKLDNSETDSYSKQNGRTLFGAFLSPSLGVEFLGEHTLQVGATLQANFGDKNKTLLYDWLFYYKFSREDRHRVFVGSFGTDNSLKPYTDLSMTDNMRYSKHTFQGAMYQFRNDKGYTEVIFDWIGMMKSDQRERIALWSASRYDLDWFHAGYELYINHYSVSYDAATRVVDNVLLSPRIGIHFTKWLPLEAFELSLGWIQTFQRDRISSRDFIFPMGGYADFRIAKWGVYIYNRFYYGGQLLPFYNRPDPHTGIYGEDLYFTEIYYGTDENYRKTHIYDRLAAGWKYNIKDFLEFDLSLVFHIAEQGKWAWQQKATVRFHFDQNIIKRWSSNKKK
ncbi:MAG: hypothetical protein HUJ89_04215 [Bacteroidales bacterium]|nr:hypothetical protein [Bacteroidales bacterium]